MARETYGDILVRYLNIVASTASPYEAEKDRIFVTRAAQAVVRNASRPPAQGVPIAVEREE
jgi:hypothetical protein